MLKKEEEKGHRPVPLQPLVVEAVEEVRLRADGSHVRMDAQELQQSPRPAFLHPDDDGLRELFAAEAVGHSDVARRSVVASRQVRQPLAYE